MKIDIDIPEMNGLAEWNDREGNTQLLHAFNELQAAKAYQGRDASAMNSKKGRTQNAVAFLGRAVNCYRRAAELFRHAHHAANCSGIPPDFLPGRHPAHSEEGQRLEESTGDGSAALDADVSGSDSPLVQIRIGRMLGGPQ